MTTEQSIEQNLNLNPELLRILNVLNESGHQCLLIGGCVRDAYLGIKPKDIDIEVYKISYTELEFLLSMYGRVDTVGKNFGVIVFTPNFKSDIKYDFSVPRKENKMGVGHKGFEVMFDADMTIKEAAERRDFTFNAIAFDPLTKTLYDYYGGIEDLNNKIIRHTSGQFVDDYLRILRAMQFQCRFGFTIHPETIALMKEMLSKQDLSMGGDSTISELPNEFVLLAKERVCEEWMKWAEKGTHHSLIFKFMRDTGLIRYYPALEVLKNTPQDEIYHPEGDVEIHTELCLEQIDRIVKKYNITGTEKVVLVMSVLLHDIAKPYCTEHKMKRGRMTVTSEGHEEMGGVYGRAFLEILGFNEDLIDPICKLVANHLAGVNISTITVFSGQVKAVKKLSRRLHPATIEQLLYVMDADTNGRGDDLEDWNRRRIPTGARDIKDIADGISVITKQYEYILMGRHLIEAGLKPSAEVGVILKASYDAQENGEFCDIDGAKKWLHKHLNRKAKKERNLLWYLKWIAVYLVVFSLIAFIPTKIVHSYWMSKFNNEQSAFVITFGVAFFISMPVLDYIKEKIKK